MAAPTKRLTERAGLQLGEEVSLAIRVRKGAAKRRAGSDDRPTLTLDGRRSVPATFPAGGLPIVPIVRSLKRWISDLLSGQHDLNGVLVFTRAGDCVLMGRSRFRSLRPTEVIQRFPANAAPAIDETLLADDLIPELAIDGERFIVNSIDFKALMKAAGAGDLEARYLSAQVKPFDDRAQSLATYEPDAIRTAMKGQ